MHKDHDTNEEVHFQIQAAIAEYDEFLNLDKKRKLRVFNHVSRSSGLAKTTLQVTVKGRRRRGRQKKRWEDNIKEGQEWTLSAQLGQPAENRTRREGLLQSHLWCPTTLQCYEIEQIRTEKNIPSMYLDLFV